MMAVKQDALAFELGEDWNQQKISLLEQKEKIDSDILEQVAAILKIPAEAIRNFDENQAINIITNTFNDSPFGNSTNYGPVHSNPVDKICSFMRRRLLCMSGC
jgi:hypothetical protein